MVLGLLSRNKFTFEISQGKNIEAQNFHDPGALINWVVEENIRLKVQNEQDQIVITQKNEKGVVLYAQRVIFPLDEEIDVDALLEKFYTKKPLEFDKRILDISFEETVHSEIPEIPEIPEEMQELLQASSKEVERNDSEEEEFVSHTTFEEQEGKKEEQEKEVVPVSELQILKARFLEQEKEIASLKAQIDGKEGHSSSMSDHSKRAFIESTKHHEEGLTFIDPKSRFKGDENEEGKNVEKFEMKNNFSDFTQDGAVEMILTAVKEKLEHIMTTFLEEETEKINQEIQALDQRAQITPTVTEFYSKEEAEALLEAEAQSNKAKADAIAEEERRHQQELVNIEKRFDSEYEHQVETIKSQYAQKIAEKIQEEYEAQTQALSHILQGKTDELKLRQRELNEGLKANFSQAIEHFNQAHEEVIQNVENQKHISPREIPKHLKIV